MAEAHPKFDVALVTPDGPAFDGEAEMVIVPGAAGEIGVLARHAPLVATLKAGSTRIHLDQNEVLEFATGPGFFKVELDRALALVDDAVGVMEIDDARAREQLEAAQAELAKVEAEVFLLELKAAAIDVVAEAASERGVDVVFAGSDVSTVDGEDLDTELLRLAEEART